jgi:RHS repeat-associated protein
LTSRGHKLSGNRVPLARRSTSGAVKVSTCWCWNGSDWKWFNAWGDQCFGDPTRVLERGPERTITEWQLTDINGDGYPDFVYDSTPVRFKLKKPDPPGPLDPKVQYADVWVPFAPAATITSIPGRTTTIFLDELGRERRTEVDLGSDYGNEVLVVGAREYDVLGRVAFEADAYPSSANPSTPYGATYHYKRDGEPACFIRGYGRQALTNVPDVATERFPTCFQRSFDNHVDTLEVQDAASLHPGSAQSGVKQRIVTSAIGRPIERSTLKGAMRLDYATFTHDRLGQLTSMTRYADPVGGADPVRWSWRMDSIGQVLRLEEPAAATRFYTYSDWGEMIEARWNDGGGDRRLVRRFDALGRLTAAEDRNNGVVDPDTVNTYTYDVGVPSTHLNPTFVLGRLSRASAPTGEVALSYDAYGNVNARVFTDSSNQAYVERTEYHADGRLAHIDFELPDTNFNPERVKYAYDSADRLRAVSNPGASGSRQIYRAESIDTLGRVREAAVGGTTYHAVYTDAGRNLLTEAAIMSAQGSRQFLFLGYDAVGREQVRREITNGAASGPKLNVGYDALGRLSSALHTDGVTTLGSRQITYDALGNVLALDDAVGNLDATLSYDSIDRDRICRIGYGNGGLGGTECNVVHDAVGKVVSQPTRNGTRQLAYLNSGAVRSIDQQGAHASLRYDPFGQVQELEVTGAGIQDTRHDLRFGNLIERRDETTGGTTTSVILRHVPGPGGILATRRGTRDDWIFEFGEQRGNRVFTNEDGAFVQDVDYEPFGESTSSGAAPGTPNYTSYQWNDGDALAAFGVSQLGARLYDPVIGRFLSRDPILVPRSASLTNPYAFAMNDPLNASDPSGLQVEEPQPMAPLLPFDFPGAAPSGGAPAPASPPSPPPDPWDVSVYKSGDPAIAPSVRLRRLELTIAVAAGSIMKVAASNAFRDFVSMQIYTNQKTTGPHGERYAGFCACSARQMALKHAGIIQLGKSSIAIKQGLKSETGWAGWPIRFWAKSEGVWERQHFNRNVRVDGRPLFSHPSKLDPDAMTQIARNPSVGTGSSERLRWMKIDADEARKLLDQGALVVVVTEGLAHWMTVIRDPFSGSYVYLDPYADTQAGKLLTANPSSWKEVPLSPDGHNWGSVEEYHALVHE